MAQKPLFQLKIPAKASKAGKPRPRVRVVPAVMIGIVCLLVAKAIEFGRDYGLARAATDAAASAGAPKTIDALAREEADIDAGAPPLPGDASLAIGGAAIAANSATPAGATLGAPQNCPVSPSIAEQAGLSASEIQVLQSLSDRRKTLEGYAGDLETREAVIAAAEKRVTERLAEMKALQQRVETALGGLDEKADADTAALVRVYEKMKAKDAAKVFENLDDDVLLRVARRMKEASLAAVMGAMTPMRAKQLTELLARRVDTAKAKAVESIAESKPAAPKTPAKAAAKPVKTADAGDAPKTAPKPAAKAPAESKPAETQPAPETAAPAAKAPEA